MMSIFHNDNGLEETRYVFLAAIVFAGDFPYIHIRIYSRGSGLAPDLLTLWQAFDSFRSAHPQATLQGYISSVLRNSR